MKDAENPKKGEPILADLPELMKSASMVLFLDEKKCMKWILHNFHPFGARCPECRTGLDEDGVVRFWEDQTIACKSCGKNFTARTGTFLSSKGLSYQQMVFLAYLLSCGEGNSAIADAIGCSRETVRLWRRNFEAVRKINSGEIIGG